MEDVIAQFMKLPPHVKTAVSSPQAIEKLEAIESRYNVKLAEIVMRVIVKVLPIGSLDETIERELHVTQEQAKQIGKDLISQIFSQISGYLGFIASASPDAALRSTPAHEGSLGVEGKDPEIEKYVANLSYAPKDTTYDVDQLVNQLSDLLNLGFDHVMKKRFHTIVESRLSDVRDKQMLKDQLARSTKIGGMGFTQDRVAMVAPLIEQAWNEIHAKHLKIKEVEEAHKHLAQPTVPKKMQHPTLVQQKPEPPMPVPEKKESVESQEKVEPQPEPEKKPEPVKSVPPPITPPIRSVPPAEKKAEPTPEPETAPPAHEELPPPKPKKEVSHFMPKVRRDLEESDKRVVQDIVPPSKLVGPIEELQQMSIEEFRHLGDSPEESADRLKEKIHMLEKESFQRRSEGIKAWRTSPLMKEYLDIGRESIENTKDIKQLIADRQEKNSRGINTQEFNAISEVNSSLRY